MALSKGKRYLLRVISETRCDEISIHVLPPGTYVDSELGDWHLHYDGILINRHEQDGAYYFYRKGRFIGRGV